jgi:hypothetical protein
MLAGFFFWQHPETVRTTATAAMDLMNDLRVIIF